MATDDSPVPSGLSRRAYLKLAGATAGAAALGTGDAGTRSRDGTVGVDRRTRRTDYWTGPEREAPAGASPGARYFATDTGRQLVATRSGWEPQGFSGPYVRAGRIAGVADHVVTTTAELEAAFDDLREGDTVSLAPGTYRPSRWLAIDVSGVTVVGASRRETLVKPADGSNVGGFHVGRGRRVENVTISGVGFDGNDRRMDQSVRRLHGFLVEDARNVTVRDCYATRTSPYHVHDAGGSGFTVRKDAQEVALVGNFTEDIGDRSIQIAGDGILVRGNRLTNGFDRSISLDVRHPDGNKYYSRNVSVVNNLGRENSDGSVVGASQGTPKRPGAGNYAILGNVARGRHRRTVYMGISEDVRNVAVVGNSGWQGAFDEDRSGVYLSGAVSNAVVVGNTFRAYSKEGIEVDTTGRDVAVVGNSVLDPAGDGIRVDADDALVTANLVSDAGGAGIAVADDAARVTVSNNHVRRAGSDGVRIGGTDCLVATNAVGDSGRRAAAAEVRVDGADALVTGNKLVGGADADGWAVTAPSARLQGNAPPVDRPTSVTVRDGSARLRFDRPFAEKPVVDVTPESPATWGVDYRRDASGAYVGADLRFVGPTGEPADLNARVRVRDSR
ncbi:right-handed parallel beta-helix repeat-containing protein [Halobium salinum]|uniref:Right-handed parallel beta-helix repeat-containing protein n=1 Tax=Halobium salinum TaxID=1364940 RepID=A0ABD5P6G8_9EURY|nr:right-handed parallel beta-helix repeat-containing protein [Halobium salinum]